MSSSADMKLHRIQPVTCRLVNDGPAILAPLGRIENSEDAGEAAIWYYRQAQLPHERVIAFLLNGGGRVLGVVRVSDGGIRAVLMSNVTILRAAICASAATIVLAHNHPSGCAQPSPRDLQATSEVCNAARAVGLGVLDHTIVAFDLGVWNYRSVRQHWDAIEHAKKGDKK